MSYQEVTKPVKETSDALMFMYSVALKFGKNSFEYAEFLRIMKDFKAQRYFFYFLFFTGIVLVWGSFGQSLLFTACLFKITVLLEIWNVILCLIAVLMAEILLQNPVLELIF